MNRSLRSFVMVFCGLWAIGWLAPAARAALIAYEGFDYENSGPSALLGKNSGTGWSGAWIDGGGAAGNAGFTVSQDNTSLDTATYPFEPTGDRVLAAGTGVAGSSNSMRISRLLSSTFNMGTEGGVLYASFLLQKNGSSTTTTGGNNLEFALTDTASANGVIRFGVASSNEFFIVNSSDLFAPATLGQTYLVVLKVEAHASTSDVASVAIYDSTEAVPLVEPSLWDDSNTLSSSAVIDRIRMWIGVTASGQYDEFRVGDTWASVAVPEPSAAIFVLLFGLIGGCVRRRGTRAK